MDGEDDDAKAKWAKRIVKEGHPRYELVYDMLNGIRTTVSQESARALNSIKNEVCELHERIIINIGLQKDNQAQF